MPSTCKKTGGDRLKSSILKYKFYYLRLISSRSRGSSSLSREEMILKYTPLIKYIAHRLAMRFPPCISVDDLISAGVIGLMEALKKFDPEKRVKFRTYAEFRIKGAMLDQMRSMDWVSRSVRQKAAQLEKTCRALEKKKGRAIEDEEIAQELRLSLDNYYKLVNQANVVYFLNKDSLKKENLQLSEEDLLNQIKDEKANHPFHLLSIVESKNILTRRIEELAPKERTVISLYYYEEMTLKEIGAVLGFTESRICQIHTKAILKLRDKMRHYVTDAGQEKMGRIQMRRETNGIIHLASDSLGR
jgi:RNA polymerase sigma factor for flagellar operon FliA